VTVREAVAADLATVPAPWLVPDGELESGVSLVEEADGRVVAAGVRSFTRTGATRDGVELYCEDGFGAELLRRLAQAAGRPVLLRVLPGTAEEKAAQAAGGRVVQSVPAAYFDTDRSEVQAWARTHVTRAREAGLTSGFGSAYDLEDLLDLWMVPYLRMHRSWSPTDDVQATRDAFARRFTQDLDRERTTIVRHGGTVLAAVFTFGPFHGTYLPVLMQIDPGDPATGLAGRLAVAGMLVATRPTPVEFDGHADEPTYLAILEEMPGRRPGRLTPMNLVEVSWPGSPTSHA
jgi:hypothetical protein